jgi:hypothetical protein
LGALTLANPLAPIALLGACITQQGAVLPPAEPPGGLALDPTKTHNPNGSTRPRSLVLGADHR